MEKKEIKELDEKTDEKKPVKERKLEREILGILIFMGFLVLVFVSASSYFKSLHNFEYEGLAFKEERIGEIPIYHHSYYFSTENNKLINYNLYLRKDPRINNISVEGGDISFKKNSVVFVTVNSSSLQHCPYAPLAIGQLSSFLKDNQLPVEGGVMEFWEAPLKKQDWITCNNRKGNRVIEITEGDETKVSINGNCYRIEVNNCEILEATEKFQLEVLLDLGHAKL